MRLFDKHDEHRLTLLEQQVGALLAGRERMGNRIRKLREFIAKRGRHTMGCVDCPVCRFRLEEAR